jgi:hypothetical protein
MNIPGIAVRHSKGIRNGEPLPFKKTDMTRYALKTYLLLLLCLMLYGCDAAVTAGGRTIGVSSGQFIYEDASLQAVYNFSFDRVWDAAEKTMADMKAGQLVKERRIATGRITGFIQEEKITIDLEYSDRERTSVSIRAGISGNKISRRLINDNISNNLNPVKTK